MDHYMIRQELNPETCRLEMKHAKLAGTSERRPFLISQIKASVFVSARLAMIPGTPCTRFKKGEDRRKKKREVLHLFRCYTHTHPARAGSTLKGKRKKKADTRRAKGQKQRRGGRGTDGPPEPTYTAKRTWPKQRTHLNPTTHYGEARGGIRDQMGD